MRRYPPTSSAMRITAMNPSPMTNSPCRLLHSTKSGTMTHMAFPPRNRYRSTSNSVNAEKAKVIICTRGPQIGNPAMTPMSMPIPRTARLRMPQSRLLHDGEQSDPCDRRKHQDDEAEAADGELDGEDHLVQPLVHRPVMRRHGVREWIIAEQTAVLNDQLARAKVPPEIGILNGSRHRQRHDHEHRDEEESTRLRQ